MLTHNDLLDLVADICAAEQMNLPGAAKHGWVVAAGIIRRAQSPPPVWIWFITLLLDKVIPPILEWIRTHYGTEWVEPVLAKLKLGQLPWE
jgi:hypothetical protein